MMNDILSIWLKSNIVFALLVAFFALVLRKETLHYFKRLYLLSIPIIALAFPFLKFSTQNETISKVSQSISFLPSTVQTEVTEIQSTTFIDWSMIGYWVFGIVSMMLIFLTIRGLVKVFGIINKSTKETLDVGILCDSPQRIDPFSFFNYIVLNKQSHEDVELQKIIQHEQIHVYQRHFADMLLAQLSIILCWLNPAVWLYRHYVTENLEFIVDHEVLQSGVNKKQYQYSILSTSVYDSSLVFANHFNQSLIKNRIKMMNKNLSNPRNMWKTALALPLLFFVIIATGQVSIVSESLAYNALAQKIDNYVKPGYTFKNKDVSIDFHKQGKQYEVVFKSPTMVEGKASSFSPRLYFVINNEIVTEKEFTAFDYKKNTALSTGAGAVLKGVYVSIITKKEALNKRNPLDPLYFLNGKTSSLDEFENIKPQEIKSMNTLNGKAAIDKYGEKGENGVIEIFTKDVEKSD